MRDVRIRENDTHGYPRIIRVVLLERLGQGSQAAAKRLKYDVEESDWVETDEEVQVYDPLNSFGAAEGDKLWVMFRHDSKVHEVLAGGAGIKLFRLDEGESLTSDPADSAAVHEYIGPPGSETERGEYTLYSGRMMGGAATIPEFSYVIGASLNGYWQVLSASPGGAGEVEFTVDSDFAYGDATFDATVTLVRGSVGSIEVSDTIEVDNPDGTVNATWFEGTAGWSGWGTYDPSTGRVRARGLECG